MSSIFAVRGFIAVPLPTFSGKNTPVSGDSTGSLAENQSETLVVEMGNRVDEVYEIVFRLSVRTSFV